MVSTGEIFLKMAFPEIPEKCFIEDYGRRTFQANRTTYKKALILEGGRAFRET